MDSQEQSELSPREALEQEALDALCTHHESFNHAINESTRGEVLAVISTYEDSTLKRIKEVPGDKHRKAICLNLISDQKMSESEVNDHCMFVTDENLSRAGLAHSTVNTFTAVRYIKALNYYPELEPINDGEYPLRRLSQINAIIKLTKHLYLNGYSSILSYPEEGDKSFTAYINDHEIRHLLLSNENPERLASIIVREDLSQHAEILAALQAEEEEQPES